MHKIIFILYFLQKGVRSYIIFNCSFYCAYGIIINFFLMNDYIEAFLLASYVVYYIYCVNKRDFLGFILINVPRVPTEMST